MPTVHLISGLPCSGKTTYARHLLNATDAVLFSLDRWLITAFGRYAIAAVGQEEHTRRVLACRELTWHAAVEFLRRNVDVVLDDGFFLREHRIRYCAMARAVGARATIHFLNTPIPKIEERLRERNASLPQYNFSVDRETLSVFSQMFEVPSHDEAAELVIVQDSAVNGVGNTGP